MDQRGVDFSKIKLIIWDMDETFWRGTLSEEAVVIADDHIELIKRLTDEGIINSISSKNDEAPVLDELKKAGIDDYFVFNNINWEEKGFQIADKIKAMGLRAENVLFLDDNVRNLEEAKYYSEGLMTAGPDIIPELIEFTNTLGGSDLAHKRLDRYKLLERKTEAMAGSGSKEQFLYDSHISVTINRNCLEEIDRICELVQRTNQLNYTKNRDDKDFLVKLLTNDWNDSAYICVKDKFGDYGIVGFYCFNTREEKMEHFLFSCRILGMGVEQYIYEKLGFPHIDVKEPVTTKLIKDKRTTWISEKYDEEILVDKKAGRLVRLLLKGPCDMSSIEPYLAGASVTTEFNYINSDGFVTTGQNHSMHIWESANLSKKEINDIVDEVPFIIDGDFETKLFSKKYHVICYSLLMDLSAGLYRNKKSGAYISFSSKNFPLTDPGFSQRFINKEIQGHGFDFTEDVIREFAERWEFVGTTPIDLLLRNLDYIYENAPGKPLIVLILGSEIECEKYNEEFAGLAEVYREVNPIIKDYALDHDRIRIIDPTEFISSQDDFEDCINHFSRNVYYEMAGKICEYINESV